MGKRFHLTDEQMEEIRRAEAPRGTLYELARKYGVTKRVIGNVRAGRRKLARDRLPNLKTGRRNIPRDEVELMVSWREQGEKLETIAYVFGHPVNTVCAMMSRKRVAPLVRPEHKMPKTARRAYEQEANDEETPEAGPREASAPGLSTLSQPTTAARQEGQGPALAVTSR